MSILDVENLNFGFGDNVLLKNISFNLCKGEHVGLVGTNGAGKTTLLNIITGKIIPDAGTIIVPPSVKVGFLDQHAEFKDSCSIRNYLKTAFNDLYRVENKIAKISSSFNGKSEHETEKLIKEMGNLEDILYSKDFYSIDEKIDNVATGIGLSALGLDTNVGKLSGGQRTKVKLAKLLLLNPDLLLLDEPTNYLDKEHIDWLSGYLKDYAESFIVISHDTDFLNRITNIIYHIEFTGLKRYAGNYNEFLKLKDEESKRYINAYTRQQKEIARMEDFINKNIVRATTTKRAQSRRKQLEKIDRLEKPKTSPKSYFNFAESRESGKLVFKCSSMNIGYSYSLISNLNLELYKGEKIAVTGCNGIGKSTLLKTIMGLIKPLKGKVELGEFLFPAYFEQEIKSGTITAIEDVWNRFPRKTQKEIREALAKCGLQKDHVFQRLSELSGGEQAKVRLCKLMMAESNWLLLDEPTNHLDVNSKLALKDALKRYKGTILLVCHEKEFYDGLVNKIWDMEELVLNKDPVKSR